MRHIRRASLAPRAPTTSSLSTIAARAGGPSSNGDEGPSTAEPGLCHRLWRHQSRKGHTRGTEGPHGVGDREGEPRAGHAEVRVLILRAGDSRWQREQAESADSRRFAGRNQRCLQKRLRSIKPFATHGTPARSFSEQNGKESLRTRGFGGCYSHYFAGGFVLRRRRNSIRRYSATPEREFESQFPLLSLDSVDSAVPSFQLRPAFGAATERVPPNDTMSRLVSFGSKSWDSFKHSF